MSLPDQCQVCADKLSTLPRWKNAVLIPKDRTTEVKAQVVHQVDGGLEAWGVAIGAFFALFVQCGLGKSAAARHAI